MNSVKVRSFEEPERRSLVKAIKLPEFIQTLVAGRQLLIRTISPHYVGEVVSYQSETEMYQAVGLLYTEHIPYITLNRENTAIIFVGAMGRVPLVPSMQQQIAETIKAMGEYYLTEIK